MDTPKHIAIALGKVKSITNQRQAEIIQAQEISRANRELLVRCGWLQEIIKGWYFLSRPDLNKGDSTAWYAHFWDFLRVYLEKRFDNEYCLSADSSLALYTQVSLIPPQVIVIVPKGGSNHHALLHNTSILTYHDIKNLPLERICLNGLQCMPLSEALCRVSPTYFSNQRENAEIALRLIKNPADLSLTLIKNNYKTAASRLMGAYQGIGEIEFARQIKRDLEMVGISVTPENPFPHQETSFVLKRRERSPYAVRIEAIWTEARAGIITVVPKEPGITKDKAAYLNHIDDIYIEDAYNSLSIEGYKVTDNLIERVKSKAWNPDFNPSDRDLKNALAARGYFEAFQAVKNSVDRILSGEMPANVLKEDLQSWYQKLFLPHTQAGILSFEKLIGYRTERVYIRGSRHLPPPKEAIVDAMEALFHCIREESSVAVRAILGHYLFVFIHPYMDGNGRIARFLMNTMLASGGYPWTIIENTKRDIYMDALRIADEERNLEVFARFICEEMHYSTQKNLPGTMA